jgi:adenosylcobinamide-GDP ribazoletransferase
MSFVQWIHQRLIELKISALFLTRLPLSHKAPIKRGELGRALWAAPVVGVAVGMLGAAAYWLAHVLHVPALPAATLAIAATLLATGCLHEDGLADIADGFGGGSTRERKLAIMRDSRIGTYGACALLLSVVLRVGALASIAEPAVVSAALIGAGAAGRAGLPWFMQLVPAARTDGMSAEAGVPPLASAMVAALLGLVIVIAALGPRTGFVVLLCLAASFCFMAWLCQRRIQGQTGDVLGALEQVGEILVLFIASAAAS